MGPFPRMEASDSLPEFREWIFFIPFPFPNFGNGFFSFPSLPEFQEWIFSIPFPFPNFENGFFQFPSRSRILKSHSRSPLPPWLAGGVPAAQLPFLVPRI